MSRHATKAADNVYCQTRYRAAEFNERLASRAGASELINCAEGVIADVELDDRRPSPEVVNRMAIIYNAPELLPYFCSHECIIGKSRRMESVNDLSVCQITIKILKDLKNIPSQTDRLIEIVADGKIDETERCDIEGIIKTLENISQMKDELVIQYERKFHKK